MTIWQQRNIHFCTPKPNPPWKTYNNTSMNIHLYSLCAKLNSTKQYSLFVVVFDPRPPLSSGFFPWDFSPVQPGHFNRFSIASCVFCAFFAAWKKRRLMDRFWLGSRQNVGWLHFMIFYRYKRKFKIKQKWYVQLNFWKSMKSTEKTSQSMYSYWNTLKELERRWITMEQVRMVKILYREHLSLSLSLL